MEVVPMRRAALIIVGVTLLLIAAVATPAQGKPSPLTMYRGSPFQVQQVLDSQGCYPDADQSCWVKNPTGCADWYTDGLCGGYAWNDQDDVYYTGSGYVDQPFTFREALLADFVGSNNRPHSIYVEVTSSANNLTIGLVNDHGDSWTVGAPTQSGNRWRWLFCVPDPVAIHGGVSVGQDPSLVWPLVPGSNYLPGSTVYGYAEPVIYTMMIAPTTRSARDVTAELEIAGTGSLSVAPRTISNCG